VYYVTILSVAKIMYDQGLMNNWWNDGETRVIWGGGGRTSSSQCRFVHYRSHVDRLGIEPWPRWWEASDL